MRQNNENLQKQTFDLNCFRTCKVFVIEIIKITMQWNHNVMIKNYCKPVMPRELSVITFERRSKITEV